MHALILETTSYRTSHHTSRMGQILLRRRPHSMLFVATISVLSIPYVAVDADAPNPRLAPQVTAVWDDGTTSELDVRSGSAYRVPAAVTSKLRGLTLRGLRDTKIEFAGRIEGTVATRSPWQEDRGVINIIDCRNLQLTDLEATNSQPYQKTDGIGKQESTALCVSRSHNIKLTQANLIGSGKAVLVVHSGSQLNAQECRITGYYFELLVGASKVRLDRVTFDQHNRAVPDSHAAIWVSSSMRNELTKQLFEETTVTLRDAMFQLDSGRAIACGNGSYDTQSRIIFETQPRIRHSYPAIGFAIFHRNYHSLAITLPHNTPAIPDLTHARGGRGIAKFIVYHDDPGAPSDKSPIVVDGVSSESIRTQALPR